MSGSLPRRALMLGGAAVAAPWPLHGLRAQPKPAGGGGEAGSWPSQPLRLVVPFAPGGSTDLAARVVAHGLAGQLGQPVIVENRAGAGATLGSQLVAAAPADGLTLLLSNIASHGIGPTLYHDLRYDPLRDFTHLGMIVSAPSVWVANPRFPARSLDAIVTLSRQEGEAGHGVDIASSGSGSSNHLLIVEFARLTGARLNHVPYRGAGPAMTDVIAGVVPLMSDSLPSSVAHLRQGSVQAVAMASAERHPGFPEVPTFREQGVDLVSTSWFGLSAPAGLPAPIQARLAQALRAVLAQPAVRARFAEFGGLPGEMGPEAYTRFVAAEVARWAPLVRQSGAQVD